MDHGVDKLAPGTRKPSSSPPVSLSSTASMEPCAVVGASVGSGLSETLGCRSHTRNDPIQVVFLVREKQPPHPDL